MKNQFFRVFILFLALSPGISSSGTEVTDDMISAAKAKSAEYLKKAMKQYKAGAGGAINYQNIPKPDVTPLPGVTAKQIEADFVEQNLNREPTLRTKVFITLSMNSETIKRIVNDVDKLGPSDSVIVIRGLQKGRTMRETVQYVSQLTKDHSVAVQIDPAAFERFKITKVPAFVVYYDDPAYQASCSLTDRESSVDLNKWDGVYGDVSLKYAINHLIENGEAEFRKYLKELSGRL
jgi:type-F conjugative transfer system pilin assembly protein TrbC